MEVHLADPCLYFTFLAKVLPPPFHYSLGRYLNFFFLLYILLSQDWKAKSVPGTYVTRKNALFPLLGNIATVKRSYFYQQSYFDQIQIL